MRRFVQELHRRSIWQITAIYVAGGWVALQVVHTLTESAGLPAWFPAFALGLLVIGFPIVIATAFIQEGGPRRPDAEPAESSYETTAASPERGPAGVERRPPSISLDLGSRLFTWRNAIAGGVAAFAVWGVVAAIWLALGGARPADSAGADATAQAAPRTLAVLPFALLGGHSPEDEAFAYGVHDELLTRLAKISALRVTSRSSVLAYATSPKPLPAIARELGVETILEGGIQRSGDSVRVNVQLIEAATDHHLWAESYKRPFNAEALFELQTELTRTVAAALQAELLPEEAARVAGAPTQNLAAWQLVRDAGVLDDLNSVENESAIRLLRRATALDSAYPEALSNLAFRYFHRTNSHGQDPAWMDSALALVHRARALDPESVSALHTLGLVLWWQGRFAESRTAHQRALALEFRASTASNLALTVELFTGRLADAYYWGTQAVLADPLRSWPWWTLALIELTLELNDGALEHLDRVLAIDPDFQWALYTTPLFVGADDPRAELAVARLEAADPDGGMALGARVFLDWLRGDTEQLVGTARRHQRIYPQAYHRLLGFAPHVLGTALALAGRDAEARPWLEQGLALTDGVIRRGHENPVLPYQAAQAAALLGRNDDALTWLQRAYDAGFRFGWIAFEDPALRGLRDDPRFAAWLDRLSRDLERQRAQALARVAGLNPLPPPREAGR